MATKSNTKKKLTTSKKKATKAPDKSTAKKAKSRSGAIHTSHSRVSAKERFIREIIHWICIAFCLILFLSLFGVCGVIGDFLSRTLLGCFGLMAYIFPLLLYMLIRFALEYNHRAQKGYVLICYVFLFVCLCGLSQMLFAGDDPSKIAVAYKAAAKDPLCGGICGLLLVRGLSYLLGETGTFIVFLLVLIICIVLLSRKSLLYPLQEGTRRMAQQARQQHAARKFQTSNGHRSAAEYMPGINFEATDLKHQTTSQAADTLEGEPVQQTLDLDAMMSDPEEKTSRSGSRRKAAATMPAPERAASLETKKPSCGKETSVTAPASDFHIFRAEPEKIPVAEENTAPASGAELMAEEQEKNTPSEKAKKLTPKEKLQQEQQILSEIAKSEADKKEYAFPPVSLLQKGSGKSSGTSDKVLYETAKKLEDTLNSFGVKVTVTNASCGPTVTRYELQPEQGVKVSRIVNLTDDIKLNLAVADIRIEAPIPGKAAVGIEVPNPTNSAVYLGDLLSSPQFEKAESKLSFAVGKDIAGQPVVADIAKMPHLLIAGATGSGKSVCINTLIMSILYKARPDEVKLIMIDPKVVELSVYNGIPHLLIPVVTDPKKAAGALNWAVTEMTDRYNKFAQYGVRDMKGYNKKIEALEDVEDEKKPSKMPQIVVIVDELADLMMVASSEVEDAICRLAQLARAAGIHLIIATQRPSVNVITGLIKANMPSRVAFAVSSGVDSRTILDMNGAEKLLGKGDMLFYPQGYPKPARLQGSFVSDKEVSAVVDFLKNGQSEPVQYDTTITEQISASSSATEINSNKSERDVLFEEAGRFIIEKDKASIGMLQRMFKIGFNRAARIMDQLCEAGVVSGEEGTKPRKILLSMEEFDELLSQL